jgi:FKBP-type peptidyl-prolyl cis-trans isomerase
MRNVGIAAVVLLALAVGAAIALQPAPEPPPEPTPTPTATPVPTPTPPLVTEADAADLANAWTEGVDLRDIGDGLLVGDIQEGEGVEVAEGDLASFDYRMWLVDGTLVDSSDQRPGSFRIDVGGHNVIEGWERGIAGMRVGGVRQVRVPAALGFGSRGSEDVPPDTDLVLELNLRRISSAELDAPTDPMAFEGPWTEVDLGVKYGDVLPGRGAPVGEGSRVSLHISAWLEDGTRVESTHVRRAPRQATLGEYTLPKALELAVPGMQIGGTRQIIAPPAAAFGADGKPPTIPPDATLTWEVVLVGVSGTDGQ